MKRFTVALFAAVLLSPALAQTTFPFLQEGKLRDGMVATIADECIKNSKAAYGLPGDQFVQGCLCFGRAMADSINSQEYDAMVLGNVPESISKKRESYRRILVTEGVRRQRLELAIG